MALLNRHIKVRNLEEEQPLVDYNPAAFKVDIYDQDEENLERFRYQSTALWQSDAFLLIVDYLQVYAVLIALSERWGWPMQWINYTQFALLANFDVWEFWLVQTGALNHSRASFVASESLGFGYSVYLAVWCALVLTVGMVFLGVYIRWQYRQPLYLLLYIARMKRIAFLLLQVMSLPLGITFARVFHCRYDVSKDLDILASDSTIVCYTPTHYSLMAFVALLLLVMFVLYPLSIYWRVKEYAYGSTKRRHEAYLQLKEAEYERGLDILWQVGSFYLFSSFSRRWVHFHCWKFLFKLIIVISFACSIKFQFWSTLTIIVVSGLASVVFLCSKPFRVGVFNPMLVLNLSCLAANSVVGIFLVVPPWENNSQFVVVSFIRYPTIIYILGAINLYWLLGLLIWATYLALRHYRFLGRIPLWPRLSDDETGEIGAHTKRFMRAVLCGRQILERSLSAVPLFAPVHELSEQIQIVNACCREAEYLADKSHATLWDLLDELIQAHNRLHNVSVFGMSGKSTLRETSKSFLKLMPSFARRLQQREYDFILVNPVRKRILFKLYVISVFVNVRRSRQGDSRDAGTRVTEFLKQFDAEEMQEDATTTRSRSTNNTRPTTGTASLSSDIKSSVSGRKSESVTALIEKLESWTVDHPRLANSPVSRAIQQKSEESPTELDQTAGPSGLGSRQGTMSTVSLPGEVLSD